MICSYFPKMTLTARLIINLILIIKPPIIKKIREILIKIYMLRHIKEKLNKRWSREGGRKDLIGK